MRVRTLIGLSAALFLAGSNPGRAQIIDHSHPSAGNEDLVATQSYPWGPMFLGAVCRMTDKGTDEAASIFSREKVNITRFRNSFEFQILSGGPGDTTTGEGNCADGITFTIQNAAPDALGGGGGSLGYAGIPHSVALKLDCVPNPGDPSVSSTGLFVNGAVPIGGTDLLQDGISLRSQHPFRVDMEYDGRILGVEITDMLTGVVSTRVYKIDIPATIGSRVAYVGFTAATGLGSSAQDLHKWYFASEPLPVLFQGRSERVSNLRSSRHKALVPEGATVAAWPTTTMPRTPRMAAVRKNSVENVARDH